MKEKTIRTYVNENGILCRETQKDMDKKELKRLHDMLVGSLLKRGQNGKMENYYSKLKIKWKH